MLIEREFIYMKKPGWSPRNQKAPVNWELCSRQREEFDHPLMSHSNVHRVPSIHLQVLFSGCPPLGAAPALEASLKRPVITSRALVESSRLPPSPKSGDTHPPSREQVSSATLPLDLNFFYSWVFSDSSPLRKWVWIPKGRPPTLPLLTLHKDFCAYYSLFFYPPS